MIQLIKFTEPIEVTDEVKKNDSQIYRLLNLLVEEIMIDLFLITNQEIDFLLDQLEKKKFQKHRQKLIDNYVKLNLCDQKLLFIANTINIISIEHELLLNLVPTLLSNIDGLTDETFIKTVLDMIKTTNTRNIFIHKYIDSIDLLLNQQIILTQYKNQTLINIKIQKNNLDYKTQLLTLLNKSKINTIYFNYILEMITQIF
jgi:hypothetical protein